MSKAQCFAHVLRENHPKPSLDGDQYSLTVKQVSTFCALPAVKNVEKHSVFQCLRKTGPKLGHARGVGTPKSRRRHRGAPLWGGVRGGVNPSPAGGRDLHAASSPPSGGAAGFTSLTHHRPRRQPQFTAICSKHGATCARQKEAGP